jgi:prepilin-type processing-associated H-X9-DG protein
LPVDRLAFHDLFFASQLPFGAWPRIANDQRHPGGLNNLFFDGHAETFSLHKVDIGWPSSLGMRLRWFARVGRNLL